MVMTVIRSIFAIFVLPPFLVCGSTPILNRSELRGSRVQRELKVGRVSHLRLINADTDKPIAGFDPLPNPAFINLDLLPTTNLNIEAITDGPVKTVRWNFLNATTIEMQEPWALCANDKQNFFSCSQLVVGVNSTMTVTPIHANGVSGTPVSIRITIFRNPPSTAAPSRRPSAPPSRPPSSMPTYQPSTKPSVNPSNVPSMAPSSVPSREPSAAPSAQPSQGPSQAPSSMPSARPSYSPSGKPSIRPSKAPSLKPSSRPSKAPSRKPSSRPSRAPSRKPSSRPSKAPSRKPSARPSKSPVVSSIVNIVINEIMRNPNGDDTPKEWIELYNAGNVPVNLRNWQVARTGILFFIASDLVIPVGGYVVLGQSSNSTFNGGYTPHYVYGDRGFLLGNTDDLLQLTLPNKSVFDPPHDIVRFTSAWPNHENQPGRSMSLKSPTMDNSLLGSWCATPATTTNRYGPDVAVQVNNYGTPGRANAAC